MSQYFRSKKTRDIETASETIIHNSSFTCNIAGKADSKTDYSATNRQVNHESFDNFLEKRK